MDRIGVVVPVYNVEKYLDRCVRSILAQSHRNFTLVLVDDGSPDNSGTLCDGYAGEDPRVHVIHQKNGGLSAARNAALDYLKEAGDCQWVTFVDSDDWIHPDMLAWMLEAALEVGTAVSISGYGETEGEDIWQDLGPWQTETWTPEDYYRQHFVNATIACAKLFRLECFETLRFPVGKLHEDEFTTYRVLFTQERLAVTAAPLYAYYVNREGITKSSWKPKRMDVWEAYRQQLAFFRDRGDSELYRFRLRGYLENALVQYRDARQMPGMETYLPKIRRRVRRLIRRCWHHGCIHFGYEFETLVQFYPVLTRAYRFYLEKIKKEM